MKPVERSGHLDLYILVKLDSLGQLVMLCNHTGQFGPGWFLDLKTAQQHQIMESMKGNRVEVFHIEWPV